MKLAAMKFGSVEQIIAVLAQIEVEAKLAKAITGVEDDFHMTSTDRDNVTNYYKQLSSGKPVSKKLKDDFGNSLKVFAGYLVNHGYKKYEDQLKTFNGKEATKYLDSIMTKKPKE